jgi:predicted metal-dependent peptidase
MNTASKKGQKSEQTAKETKKDKFWDAVEVREIATKLIGEDGTFTFPKNTPILYLFVDKMKDLGNIAHCSEKVEFASAYKFIMTINYEVWSRMTEREREALVFHELCHIFYDAEKDKYSCVDHDLEEFGRVVSRYGLWRRDVQMFVNAAMTNLETTPKEVPV